LGWGCNFPIAVNKLLSLVERNPRYSPNIGDGQALEFAQLNKEQIESILVFNEFFKLDSDAVVKARKCTVKFRSIKSALWAGMSASFAFQLATHMKIKTIGALFGTFAEFSRVPSGLMSISSKTVRHVEFYKTHFNIKTDSENRNYGVFGPHMMEPE
jgi:hypothetical protein